MPEAILSIDAGTTSVRVMLVGLDGSVLGRSKQTYPLSFPSKGRVETDPNHFLRKTLDGIDAAVASANVEKSDIRAVGITGQRSSLVVWDRKSGEAITPIVSWQDLRGAAYAREISESGTPLSPLAAAAKLPLVLEELAAQQKTFKQTNFRWGNADTFLANKLSGQRVFSTDASFACASGYYDFSNGDWNADLLIRQELNFDFFPAIANSDADFGMTSIDVCGFEAPITGIVGDQQSAAFAQNCISPGDDKLTLGTSGTLNVDTGNSIMETPGYYPLVYHRLEGRDRYCLEGMVITAGAMLDWAISGLGLAPSLAELEQLATTVDSPAGVSILPALQGVGSPHNRPGQFASIHGLTRGTTGAHVARAVYDGIAFRLRDVIEARTHDGTIPVPEIQKIDGGLSASSLMRQTLANVIGKPVHGFNPLEATGFGAAKMAARRLDCTTPLEPAESPTIVEPSNTSGEYDERYRAWRNEWF